ncbi:hypothetical protein FHS47_000396 [Lutibacter sp. SG786]|nr:hypothetical protein [Luteibacter sp. SG786]
MRAGVFDSASLPRRRRPAVQAGPLRAFSARTPSTPDIAARGTGTGSGRCGVLVGEPEQEPMVAPASCRPRRWVPAFAGTTIGGDAAMPSHRALVGTASLCVGAASAAMGARESARCRGIAGIAGSHTEHWAIVFLGNRGQVSSPPWRLLQQPRESRYLTLPNRRACPTVVPAKAGTQRLKRGRSPQTNTTTQATHQTPHPAAPSDAGFQKTAQAPMRGRTGEPTLRSECATPMRRRSRSEHEPA